MSVTDSLGDIAFFESPEDIVFNSSSDMFLIQLVTVFDPSNNIVSDSPGDTVFGSSRDMVFESSSDIVFDSPSDMVFNSPGDRVIWFIQ